jgi:hypothetical protein
MRNAGTITRAVLAVVLCSTLIWTGCSTAWVGQAEEIVAALIPAAANIVTLVAALQGKSVSAADMQTIQDAGTQAGADLQLISSLIAAYQKADAATQPGILNQIESAINATQGNLQGLLPALHIKDAATQAKITAVIGIVLSEVQSLAAILPMVKAGTTSASSGLQAESQNSHPVAQNATREGHPQAPLSASQFVASFNATLTAKTGNADLDKATAGLEIHRHGKVARWVTGGVLK